jgi:hypothetical protein
MVGNTTYASDTYSSYEGCYSLTFSSSSSGYSSRTTYIGDYAGTPTGYDIGYERGADGSGDIWMAVDDATSPVKCYQASTGGMVEGIEASIGIGSDIRGVCFEDSSSRYLWVSNQTTDQLYRIDLGTAVGEGGRAGIKPLGINVGQNPFYGVTTVYLNGFGDHAILQVFDLCGREVLSEPAGQSCMLDGSLLPAGVYVLRAIDPAGRIATASVVKL